MMTITVLTHRYRDQQFEVKVTSCHHHMMRQRYRDCSGIQVTDWRRVTASTVKQLRTECVVTEEVK